MPAPRDLETDRRYAPPEWVRAARAARGLTQGAVARRLDIETQTVSNRERGAVRCGWEAWMAILRVLDLPISWEPGQPVPPLDRG